MAPTWPTLVSGVSSGAAGADVVLVRSRSRLRALLTATPKGRPIRRVASGSSSSAPGETQPRPHRSGRREQRGRNGSTFGVLELTLRPTAMAGTCCRERHVHRRRTARCREPSRAPTVADGGAARDECLWTTRSTFARRPPRPERGPSARGGTARRAPVCAGSRIRSPPGSHVGTRFDERGSASPWTCRSG